jgi:outer membrane protein TolC
MKKVLVALLLLVCPVLSAQKDTILSYDEFLGMVKRFHPEAKQANLVVTMAQAALMEARGAFDPQIEAALSKKQFAGTEYFNLANGAFTIPTWFGLDLRAGFEDNSGVYLNPQSLTPDRGQASVGVNVALGQGLWINRRIADVRRARMMVSLSEAERQLMAIDVLYAASDAYFAWKRQYEELKLYENYLTNATQRFRGVKSLIEAGDRPAIDSIEAGIIVNTRLLNLEDARLKFTKARLDLSNYLWTSGNVPLELGEDMVPETTLSQTIPETLKTNGLLAQNPLDGHPKITVLENRINILDVDRRLRANMLLPRLDLSYSWLSEAWDFNNDYRDDYRLGVNFSVPLFMRRERGGLKLAKLKVQDARFELQMERLQLGNKIKANQAEITSLERQQRLVFSLVGDYQRMLESEDRLFIFGESSIFLINARENTLITAQLNRIAMEYRWLLSHAELFRTMARPD